MNGVPTCALPLGAGGALCTVLSFPHRTTQPPTKPKEESRAEKNGAQELNAAAHLPHFINHNIHTTRLARRASVKAARATRPETLIKVIIESAVLLALGPDRGEGAIATACRAIRESGCDLVKTSTGFHPAGGATEQAVRLIKKHAQGLQIKAAGG